jgi:hypothetical protein
MGDKEQRARDKPPTGFPEPPGDDPGDLTRHDDPHHTLNNPVGEPDPTGSTSTSEPHPSQDPEASPVEAPERDKLDD